LLVTSGNVFLEKALALLPGVSAFRADPGQPLPPGPFDVAILDATLPATGTLPPGHLLLIAPPRSSDLLTVSGAFSNTRITRVADDPLLRYVDTANLHVRQARAIELPPWARPLIEAEGGPLLFAGETGGRRVAVLTFDLHDSDLPLQVAFPILLSNLFDWFAPAQLFDAPAGLPPGQPLAIRAPADATVLVVIRPDGSEWRAPVAAGALNYAETEQLGAYTVRATTPAGVVEQQFAVNLFAPEESDIRPRDTITVGTAPVGTAPGGATGQREIWPYLAAAALVVLALEWWVYHRGTAIPLGARGRESTAR
jgi:hypothetical protein